MRLHVGLRQNQEPCQAAEVTMGLRLDFTTSRARRSMATGELLPIQPAVRTLCASTATQYPYFVQHIPQSATRFPV